MRRFALPALACGLLLQAGPALAQPYYPPPPYPGHYSHSDPRLCDLYARDQAHRYAPPGSGAIGGAVRGAVGGAVFGAVIGGKRGARRGAAAGAGLGVVAGGVRAARERDYAYRLAYDDCMGGFRR